RGQTARSHFLVQKHLLRSTFNTHYLADLQRKSRASRSGHRGKTVVRARLIAAYFSPSPGGEGRGEGGRFGSPHFQEPPHPRRGVRSPDFGDATRRLYSCATFSRVTLLFARLIAALLIGVFVSPASAQIVLNEIMAM